MKDSKQIAESVFRKSEERLQEKKRRIAVIRRNTMIASGMCAVLLIGFGIWKNDALKHAPERDPHSSVITETETTTVSSPVKTTSYIQTATDTSVSTETTSSDKSKTTKTTALTSKNDRTTTQTTVSDEDTTTENIPTEETETSAHTTKHTTEHTTRKTQTTTARTTNTTAKTTIRTTRATTAQTTIARTTRTTTAHTYASTTEAYNTTTTIQYSHHVTTRVTTSDIVEPSLPPSTRVTTIATTETTIATTAVITTTVSPEIIEITETEWQFDTMNAETVTLEFITEPYSRIDISAEWYLSDDVSWTAIADSEGRITISFSTDGFSGTVDIKADDPESDVKLINILYDGEDIY